MPLTDHARAPSESPRSTTPHLPPGLSDQVPQGAGGLPRAAAEAPPGLPRRVRVPVQPPAQPRTPPSTGSSASASPSSPPPTRCWSAGAKGISHLFNSTDTEPKPRPVRRSASICDRLQRARLASNRMTAGAVHLPPRGAGMPLASSSAAMARSDVRPPALISAMTGARSATRGGGGLALRDRFGGALGASLGRQPCRVAEPGSPRLRRGERRLGPGEIISRSCSATAARMRMVSRLAVGKSPR